MPSPQTSHERHSREGACEIIEIATFAKLRSVIPAKAGIPLSSWNKLLYGSPPARGRRRGRIATGSPIPSHARRRELIYRARTTYQHGSPPPGGRRGSPDYKRLRRFTRSEASVAHKYQVKENARGHHDKKPSGQSLCFDAYGTLFDVHAPAATLASGLASAGLRFRPRGARSSSNIPGFAARLAATPILPR